MSLTQILKSLLLQKVHFHLNQVASSHPQERFHMYHKLQKFFDKWMFHLRYACNPSVKCTDNIIVIVTTNTQSSEAMILAVMNAIFAIA